MKKNLRVTVICIFLSVTSVAQQMPSLSGVVFDTSGVALPDVFIKIVSGKDSATTTTNTLGAFYFTRLSFANFSLSASMVGYKRYTHNYSINKDSSRPIKLDPITLFKSDNRLQDVVVVAANPITIKEDTIEYKANAFKVREGAPVEEVIRKLPGVTVDKNGTVTAQGKQVARVRVNGRNI